MKDKKKYSRQKENNAKEDRLLSWKKLRGDYQKKLHQIDLVLKPDGLSVLKMNWFKW